MPTVNQYKKMLSLKGQYNGQVRKTNADMIVEASWYNDLATRTCYLFDYYHDPQPLVLNNLIPDETMQIPVDLKYIVYSSQTFDKDSITYHIMFKPSEEKKDKTFAIKFAFDFTFILTKNSYAILNDSFP